MVLPHRRKDGSMPRVRELIKQSSYNLFLFMDRLGLHVLPRHYYTPIPDHGWLRRNKPLWARRTDLTGLDWNLDEQVAWLKANCAPYYGEVEGLGLFREAATFGYGPGYGAIESQVLHCVIRSLKPPRIIEVGSGVSTVCSLRAADMNKRDGARETRITCIEPYPNPKLVALENITLLKQMLQETDLTAFDALESGDLLFIDSSHAVKPGSDVLMLMLEVVPRLKPGVTIHVHDVYLPYTYPRDLLDNYFGWQETALLLALLKNNPRLGVACCLSALHYDRQEAARAILTDYEPEVDAGPGLGSKGARGYFPSSAWLVTR
jgi:predicted O-methyltransferase YrrM